MFYLGQLGTLCLGFFLLWSPFYSEPLKLTMYVIVVLGMGLINFIGIIINPFQPKKSMKSLVDTLSPDELEELRPLLRVQTARVMQGKTPLEKEDNR